VREVRDVRDVREVRDVRDVREVRDAPVGFSALPAFVAHSEGLSSR